MGMATALLIFAAYFLILFEVADSCGDHLRTGLKDRDACPHVSMFASCLAAKHRSMGSPFGVNVERRIGIAVRNTVKELCNANCSLLDDPSNNAKSDVDLDSLSAGNELKLCAFDVIVATRAKKRGVCDRIDDVAKCVIAVSTDVTYLSTKETVDVATYVMAETLRISLGIKCPKPAIKRNLREKCLGLRQTG